MPPLFPPGRARDALLGEPHGVERDHVESRPIATVAARRRARTTDELA